MAKKKAKKGTKQNILGKNFFKQNWNWILIIAILILAFYLRSYHIDYPVIGYHNQKEVNLLPKARTFAEDGFFKYGLFIEESASPPFNVTGTNYLNVEGAGKGLFPTIQLLTWPMFKLFGYKLWAARLIAVLLSTFSILFFYLLLRKVSGNEFLSLTTSFLLAVNPLLVFFGRQYQLINPALFFMSIALYAFFLWREKDKNQYLIWFAIGTLFSTLSKYNFVIIIGLFVGIFFPYKRFKEIKKYYKLFIIVALILVLIPAWLLYNPSNETITTKDADSNAITSTLELVDLGYIFNPIFQNTFKPYIKDAFTIGGAILALIGVIFFGIYRFIKREITFFDKFMIVSFFTIIIYIIIAAMKIAGHVYHYYPIVIFVMLFLAYLIVMISNTIAGFFKDKKIKIPLKIIIGVIIIILLLPGFVKAKNRMFDTQFPGMDIAGDYIKEHKEEGDRLMHSTHQAYGVIWHGDIKGSREGIPKNIDYFKFAEQERNVKWIFIYNWDFNRISEQDEVWNYIESHYSLKQIAFANQQPLYLLLHKGGSFNESTINEELQKYPAQKKKYEYTFGEYYVDYVNLG